MKYDLPKEVADAINVLYEYCGLKACDNCPLCTGEKECVFKKYSPCFIKASMKPVPTFVVEVED